MADADFAAGRKKYTHKEVRSAPPKWAQKSHRDREGTMFQLRMVLKKNMGLMVPVKAHRE